jgi:C-terminal processing protease CtpA/Prc
MATINKKQWGCIAIALLIGGCTPKDTIDPEPSEHEAANAWIETTMRRYYLWEDEIPPKDKLNLKQEAEPFFHSLLTEKDGKTRNNTHYYYSSINKKSAATKAYQGEGYSFGFEFQYYYIENLQVYALLVLYVIPDSPADKAGMKRGDWIMEIAGLPVSGQADELLKALDTTSPATQTFGLTRHPRQPIAQTLTLTAATVDDNPVFLRKIISHEGRRIAYLVYNHFTAGKTDNDGDEEFNNTLREAFREFNAQKPDEFILDLRYNGGGLVSSAQLLATMLAPAAALGDVFCRLTYNGQNNSYSPRSLMLDTKYMQEGAGGENLDLSRLYVITSSRTASASEAVINGLRPYPIDLVLVGEQTEGKNVGSVTFDDDRFEWELHPIVSRLSNKDNFSAYEGGFKPDVDCDESDASTYYELGDEQEFMLKVVLDLIANGKESAVIRSAGDLHLVPLYHSLDRKRTNAVVLDR